MMAAKALDIADSGDVLLSAEAREAADTPHIRFVDLGAQLLEGFSTREFFYRVERDALAPQTATRE